MGPGISSVWGGIEPHFAIIFGIQITHLNTCFVMFLHNLCHPDRYSAQGKNKFNVYPNLVINIIFMILLTQIYII